MMVVVSIGQARERGLRRGDQGITIGRSLRSHIADVAICKVLHFDRSSRRGI